MIGSPHGPQRTETALSAPTVTFKSGNPVGRPEKSCLSVLSLGRGDCILYVTSSFIDIHTDRDKYLNRIDLRSNFLS